MKKRRLIPAYLMLCLVLSLASVYGAEFNEQGTYDWLKSQSSAGAFGGGDILSTAWAAIAFSRANLIDDAATTLGWLEQSKNPSNCWPSQSCFTRETALVALAKHIANEDTDDIVEYFRGSMMGYTGSGAWLLEITTPDTGICTLTYEVLNQSESKDITVEEGRFPQCGNSNFLDLNTCLKSNLIKNTPNLDINVDCSSLESAPYVTLLYKTGNSFYIASQTEENSVVDVVVPNGCYGRGPGDTCNKEATMYAAWVLNEIGSDLDVSVYLRESYDESSGLHNALLYFISKETKYLTRLKELQSNDGSISKDIVQTALAVKAWGDDPTTYDQNIHRATAYIQGRQRDSGSINDNVVDTAAAIYGAFGYGAVSSPTCSDGIMNQDERGIDCGGVCEAQTGDDCCSNLVADIGEEDVDCGGACEPCSGGGVCNSDGVCDDATGETSDNCADCQNPSADCYENNICETDFKETAENCPSDCKCGDSICDSSEDAEKCPEDCSDTTPTEESSDETAKTECGDGVCDSDEDEDSCPDDCVTKKGSSSFATIIIIVIVLAILGGGGYFAYKQGWLPIGGAPKKPQQQGPPGYKPFSGRTLTPRPRPRPGAPARPRVPPRPGMRPSSRPPTRRPASGGGIGGSLAEARKLLKK